MSTAFCSGGLAWVHPCTFQGAHKFFSACFRVLVFLYTRVLAGSWRCGHVFIGLCTLILCSVRFCASLWAHLSMSMGTLVRCTRLTCTFHWTVLYIAFVFQVLIEVQLCSSLDAYMYMMVHTGTLLCDTGRILWCSRVHFVVRTCSSQHVHCSLSRVIGTGFSYPGHCTHMYFFGLLLFLSFCNIHVSGCSSVQIYFCIMCIVGSHFSVARLAHVLGGFPSLYICVQFPVPSCPQHCAHWTFLDTHRCMPLCFLDC